MTFIYCQGQYVPLSEAVVPVTNLSYLYGEGAFETFRTFEGKALFLNEHQKRMEWSLTYLNLPFEPIDLKAIIQTLLKKNDLKDAHFKWVASAYPNPQSEDELCLHQTVFIKPLAKDTKPSYRLKTIHTFKNDESPLANLKTTSYLTKRLAQKEAKDDGFDDGLLMNSKNQVTETSTANIFWVDQKGVLKRVLKDCLHLPGITQNEFLKMLQVHSLKISESIISPLELSHAKEIFITNSILGIKPVIGIDHRKISGGVPGDITLMLMDLWQKHLKSKIES